MRYAKRWCALYTPVVAKLQGLIASTVSNQRVEFAFGQDVLVEQRRRHLTDCVPVLLYEFSSLSGNSTTVRNRNALDLLAVSFPHAIPQRQAIGLRAWV